MSVFAIGDPTMSTIYQAMQGLSARQQAVAQDIANIDTPSYRGHVVDFESSLSAAVASGDPSSSTVTVRPSTAPGGVDGNNVDLGSSEVTEAKTSLAFQTMVHAMNAKFNLLSTAISGQPNAG